MTKFSLVLVVLLVSCSTNPISINTKPPIIDPGKDNTSNDPKDTSEKSPFILDLPLNHPNDNTNNNEKPTKNPNNNGNVTNTEDVTNLASAIELQKQLVAKNPSDIEKKRLALLYLAEDKPLEAERILSTLTNRDDKLVKFIEPFLLNELGDFKLSLAKMQELIDDFPSSKIVKIAKAELCKRVHGFRRYELYGDGGRIKPGNAALIYIEVQSFSTKKAGDNYLMHIKYDWELLDDRDKKITVTSWVTADSKNKEDRKETMGISREFYQSFRLPLPQNLATGNYKIKITVDDALSGKSDSTIVPIYVTDY